MGSTTPPTDRSSLHSSLPLYSRERAARQGRSAGATRECRRTHSAKAQLAPVSSKADGEKSPRHRLSVRRWPSLRPTFLFLAPFLRDTLLNPLASASQCQYGRFAVFLDRPRRIRVLPPTLGTSQSPPSDGGVSRADVNRWDSTAPLNNTARSPTQTLDSGAKGNQQQPETRQENQQGPTGAGELNDKRE